MTNEVIKVLILLALYGVLEITLFSSSIGRLAKRTVQSGHRHLADGKRRARDE
ncbi:MULTISPECIES: hypothetical protein [Bradyrhizobium]|uniref:hypothetical protein n=1 Tax=Bradyrhizobium TaxID=374 RepID=UPI001374BFC5|nr:MULTISPECIES: hypothetical protein [Bradyrhizobium]